MKALVVSLVLALAAAAAPMPGHAQQPSKTEIVNALTPHPKSRSFRGVSIEGHEPRPSFDLHVPFDYDSDTLTPDAILVLRRLGEALKDPTLANYRFRLAGFTDAHGTAQYNQALSERRAASVRNYLIFQYDIGADRLESVGYGMTHLADPSHPDAAINRRVQITNLGPNS